MYHLIHSEASVDPVRAVLLGHRLLVLDRPSEVVVMTMDCPVGYICKVESYPAFLDFMTFVIVMGFAAVGLILFIWWATRG